MYNEAYLKKIKDYSKVFDGIVESAVKYVNEYNIKSFVLGVSGGIDSTLVALIAREVCDKTNIPLIGRNFPIRPSNAGGSGWEGNTTAKAIGEGLCDYFAVDNLSVLFNFTWDYMSLGKLDTETETQYKIRRGNVMARLRMMHLYDLAQRTNGLVLSTDNLTEHLLGFWTLHGDVGDYGMIQELWKTEVYRLTEWILQNRYSKIGPLGKAIAKSILKNPTDGLGVSSGDLEQLQAKSYKEVDDLLIEYVTGINSNVHDFEDWEELIKHPVIKRHNSSAFKRTNPLNIKRNTYIY